MENLTFQNVVQVLLERIPGFKQSEEFKQWSDELDLSYPIFGAFRRFYVKCYKENKKQLVRRMSNFLEETASSKDIKLEELVAYGFLENLDKRESYYKGIVKTFGKHTRELLKEVDEFWASYEEDIRKQIYKLWKKGQSIASLEEQFGVKKKIIHRILKQAEHGDFRTPL